MHSAVKFRSVVFLCFNDVSIPKGFVPFADDNSGFGVGCVI
jgi:hypothetical protein